ncbi:MAG: peptidylprolyl isomerase [Terriglobales bacterium]
MSSESLFAIKTSFHSGSQRNRAVLAMTLGLAALMGLLVLTGVMGSPAWGQVASHAPALPVSTASNTASSTTANMGAPSQPVASLQVTGKVVARVNGTELTDRDLLREMFAMFPYARQHNGFPKGQEAEIRRGALEMIEYEELVYQEAERRKITIPATQVNSAVAEYRDRFQSDEDFREYLKAEMGGSEDRLRQQIRRSLLIDKMLKMEVGDRSKVTEAEARAYYDNNRKKFFHPELFAFQTISIMPKEDASADAKQKARQRAEDALKQAKATKTFQDFGLLAEKISDDDYRINMGDHHLVKKDKLPAEMLKQTAKMQPGDISTLIPAGNFYFFFRLYAHVPPGYTGFAEVKSRLMGDLQKTKSDRLRGDLDKRLRLHAKVEEVQG